MSDESERRRYTRVDFDTAATLVQADTVFHTKVIDISLNGVLLETPNNYQLRTDMSADISIFLSEDTEVQMKVQMVHSGSDCLGFRCTSIDVESASHLRRLIELNIDDANAAERVIDELLNNH
ncbi:PilZ domain-containing protein [Agaribacterium sp. ZY112]|uniref:PilZ domain-containing protein n=1 Tax=Agaribacterium sp. ZY112 TaxID=3233574 RepID=UPI0035236AB6